MRCDMPQCPFQAINKMTVPTPFTVEDILAAGEPDYVPDPDKEAFIHIHLCEDCSLLLTLLETIFIRDLRVLIKKRGGDVDHLEHLLERIGKS